MTYDERTILTEFHADQNLNYPLLQDEGVKHVDAYGVRNQDYEPGHRGYGIPNPGIIYVDASGDVVMKFAVPGYRDRPPLADIYQALLPESGAG